MKKEYIEPSIKAIKIKKNYILAGSIQDSGSSGTSVNPDGEAVTDPNEMDSFDASFE